MAILSTVKKGYLYFKTLTGYIKVLPKTLASLVEMADGTTVEDNINELNRNSLLFPNYDNVQKIYSGDKASNDGYVCVGIRASVERYVTLSINGVLLSALTTPAAHTGITPLIPVRKGDIITFSVDDKNTGGTTYQTIRCFFPI